jgi:hypothetical protein
MAVQVRHADVADHMSSAVPMLPSVDASDAVLPVAVSGMVGIGAGSAPCRNSGRDHKLGGRRQVVRARPNPAHQRLLERGVCQLRADSIRVLSSDVNRAWPLLDRQ